MVLFLLFARGRFYAREALRPNTLVLAVTA